MSLCRAQTNVSTHPASHPAPTSEFFPPELRGRHERCKWDRVTSDSFSVSQVRRLPGPLPKTRDCCVNSAGYTYIDIYVFYIYIYVCMYVYICMYVCLYVHAHTNTYTHRHIGYMIPASSVLPACVLVCGVPLAMVGHSSQTSLFRNPRVYCVPLYLQMCT